MHQIIIMKNFLILISNLVNRISYIVFIVIIFITEADVFKNYLIVRILRKLLIE
ncbi:hypothetical protein HNQ62_001875 [Sulfurisphaera ohwakuensis]|uniref:Uncharacterized protein n=1 Tax=Sulfurisphaera ohwakuensis TaxID=69656 RepID=A0A7J9RV34_SULOH|nr:hypothetical protein [Sulfurisphaera ohwakuensis]